MWEPYWLDALAAVAAVDGAPMEEHEPIPLRSITHESWSTSIDREPL